MTAVDFYLFLSGILGGCLAGMLGIGGGIIFIVVLPLVLENAGVCSQGIVPYTVANSILATFMASISGNAKLIFKGRFSYKEVFSIGIFAGISAILAMKIVVLQAWYSKNVFNGFVILLLLFMLFSVFIQSPKNNTTEKEGSLLTFSFIGFFAGIVAALSGLGGGILVVPMLMGLFNMNIKKAKVISLGVIGVISIMLIINNALTKPICLSEYLQVGLIVIPSTLILSIGVIIGTPTGIYISQKLSEKNIRLMFAVLLVIFIARKTYEIIINFY